MFKKLKKAAVAVRTYTFATLAMVVFTSCLFFAAFGALLGCVAAAEWPKGIRRTLNDGVDLLEEVWEDLTNAERPDDVR